MHTNVYNKLLSLYDKNIPLKSTKRNTNSRDVPWVTKGILNSRKTKINYIKNLSKIQMKEINQSIRHTETNSIKLKKKQQKILLQQ